MPTECQMLCETLGNTDIILTLLKLTLWREDRKYVINQKSEYKIYNCNKC